MPLDQRSRILIASKSRNRLEVRVVNCAGADSVTLDRIINNKYWSGRSAKKCGQATINFKRDDKSIPETGTQSREYESTLRFAWFWLGSGSAESGKYAITFAIAKGHFAGDLCVCAVCCAGPGSWDMFRCWRSRWAPTALPSTPSSTMTI